MTLLKHEMKQGRLALCIWTAVISFMLAVCVFVYPEMRGGMENFNDVFASMGSFTEAFGMDQLNFGTLVGFYAVECGNVLGLGGAFFACLLGISALAKEEKNGTAEILLTHPIKRSRVLTEKLCAVLLQIVLMNAVIFGIAALSVALIGEEIPLFEMSLLHLSYFLMQIELCCICFGISAFLSKGGVGIGIGLGTAMYFLNILANMTESVEFIKYITPFGYCDGAGIVNERALEPVMIVLGMAYAVVFLALAYRKYRRKDIR